MSRLGLRKGVKAVTFAVSWAYTAHELGREPKGFAEYAEFWKVDRVTGYRDLKLFRDAFEPLGWRTPVWFSEQYAKKLQEFENRDVATIRIGQMPVPAI